MALEAEVTAVDKPADAVNVTFIVLVDSREVLKDRIVFRQLAPGATTQEIVDAIKAQISEVARRVSNAGNAETAARTIIGSRFTVS